MTETHSQMLCPCLDITFISRLHLHISPALQTCGHLQKFEREKNVTLVQVHIKGEGFFFLAAVNVSKIKFLSINYFILELKQLTVNIKFDPMILACFLYFMQW